MTHAKEAHTDHPIEELLAKRWSPCGFADRGVATSDLLALLEAARWAPSSYNEQPWRYLLARRSQPEAFSKLLSCLVESNQVWAKHAPVLLIGIAMLQFERNGKPNKATHHDLGLAAGNLCVEATARGLVVHQMIGIVPERVRELYGVPEWAEPLADIADESHSRAAGDSIAEKVRELTGLPDSSLHVSIAGGRKTMGFYAGYALSLFGRPQDRLSHVIVSDPFE